MSPAAPPNRFCSTCGQAAAPFDLHCARCGHPLQLPPPAASAARGGGGGRLPGWILGLIGCLVVTPVVGVVAMIVAAIAIPNFTKAQARSKSNSAEVNLRAIWAAQQSWAAMNGGEYLEFYITPDDLSDENWKALNVHLPQIHHEYESFWDGEELWVTAYGNIDADPFYDEWELSSFDGVAVHFENDVTDESSETRDPYFAPEAAAEAAYQNDSGGDAELRLEALDQERIREIGVRSATARANLEEIWAAQVRYRKDRKNYMSFTDGGPATWAALQVTLPEKVEHRYVATVEGGTLLLTAEGNLDEDSFLDLWAIDPRTGAAVHLQRDSADLDVGRLEDLGFPGIGAAGGTAPDRQGQTR